MGESICQAAETGRYQVMEERGERIITVAVFGHMTVNPGFSILSGYLVGKREI